MTDNIKPPFVSHATAAIADAHRPAAQMVAPTINLTKPTTQVSVLAELGYASPTLRASLMSFQNAHKLKATGVCDEATAAALLAALRTKGARA